MNTSLSCESIIDEKPKSYLGIQPLPYCAYSILMVVSSVFSATLLYPLAYYLFEKKVCDNTFVENKRLIFKGKLLSCYGIYFSGLLFAGIIITSISFLVDGFDVLERFLSIMTGSIIAFFTTTRLRKWKAKNTFFSEEEDGKSYLSKNLFYCIVTSALTSILGAVTLGIGFPLAYKLKAKYYINLTVINDSKLHFNGKSKDIYTHFLKWIFYAIITFGLYLAFIGYYLKCWECENTVISDK